VQQKKWNVVTLDCVRDTILHVTGEKRLAGKRVSAKHTTPGIFSQFQKHSNIKCVLKGA
jgi:hypothetical protein